MHFNTSLTKNNGDILPESLVGAFKPKATLMGTKDPQVMQPVLPGLMQSVKAQAA